MKLPKTQLFWQSVASPFLKLVDLSCLEVAIDNREERRGLMLPMPIDETAPGDDELPPYFNPYETTFRLNTNDWTEINSEEMREWCERRRILVKKVQINFMPVFDRSEGSSCSWDLFTFVTDLEIEEMDENYHMLKKLFPRLHSLRKFCLLEESIGEVELLALVKQVNANVTRSRDISPGPCQLEELQIHLGDIGPKALKYMIGNLSSIRKIMFAFAEIIKDDMIELMALRWSHLTSIDILNTKIGDSGLEAFRRTRQQFEYVRLVDVDDITIVGVKSLLSNSSTSLTELSLSGVRLSEKDMGIILQQCSRIKALTLDYMSECPGTVLRVISKKCPNLTQLKLHELEDSDKVRDFDIQAFVTGCPKISKLHLTGFTSLTPKSVDMMDQTYSRIITKFWVNDKQFLQKCRRTQFSTCPNRLLVEPEDDEFDDEVV